jgi:hypothetical protein
METIEIRSANLRRAAEQVPAFIEKLLGCEADHGLRTSVEEDMGSAGLDTEELILSFSKQFDVDISRFDFTGFISAEPGVDVNPLYGLVLLFMLAVCVVGWATKFLIGVVYWPFNPKAAAALIQEPIGNPFASTTASVPVPCCRQDSLTIGDFVASAAAGHFVKREQVRFVLI